MFSPFNKILGFLAVSAFLAAINAVAALTFGGLGWWSLHFFPDARSLPGLWWAIGLVSLGAALVFTWGMLRLIAQRSR